MGMFDYVQCEVPLPETPEPPPDSRFQTKDTPDQNLTTYRITPLGDLAWKAYHMEKVPKSERPFPEATGALGEHGAWRRVEGDEEVIEFCGDIHFYTGNNPPDTGWWEYRARFDAGKLVDLVVYEFRAPQGRDVDAEIVEQIKGA